MRKRHNDNYIRNQALPSWEKLCHFGEKNLFAKNQTPVF